MGDNDYVRLLRHATLLLKIGALKILVDPMLSSKDEMDPVQNCGNDIRIPMVDLKIDREELSRILTEVDAVVISHMHRDHWDAAAQQLIEKTKLIICQPSDAEKIGAQGFLNVLPVKDKIILKGITINRTKGKHGTGEIGRKMGEVSGFVFKNDEVTIYVAGDTIWCDDVENALNNFKPGVTVLNAGGAQFLTGDPITMTPADIIKVHQQLLSTKIIAVHMDTVNHCFITRSDLQKLITENKLTHSVFIPLDNDLIEV